MSRKVYVLLTDTGTVLGKMIKLYTKKPLNHASIVIDEQFNKVYSFGRRNPRNPFFAGFVEENVRGGLFRNADCAIYCITITEKQFQKMICKLRDMEDHKEEYRYNLIGLIAVMLNMEMTRKNAFFCSHFVAAILEESGIDIKSQKPLSLVTPHDIKESAPLELIYEGKLSTFITDSHRKYYKEFTPDSVEVI
ncbi:hypothetical protein SAMN05444673_1730 [Bacillus sp. OV166]|uniref:hypothetical protein n=1 Tax=Bacillus sp. OV166 TaxID=1882763 RepID=UPI000A2AC783|nr:hypothetical protein [Bacillus sp. OV166]SMQ69018.1 hypothetical protein SAMN05444673_1730 [Bacillus sp. OV166]